MAAVLAIRRGGRDRRVAVAALVLAAALAGALRLALSHGGSETVAPPRPAELNHTRPHGHLTFGMTPHQVQRLTGRPAIVEGNCWLFRPTRTGAVGSISVQPPWAAVPFDSRTTRDLKLCFTAGTYSYSYLRGFDQRRHRWVWEAWPLTLVHGTSDVGAGY